MWEINKKKSEKKQWDWLSSNDKEKFKIWQKRFIWGGYFLYLYNFIIIMGQLSIIYIGFCKYFEKFCLFLITNKDLLG